MQVRDEGICQFPGCESRGYLHLHHVKHWAKGGTTDLDNLILLCSFHEGGFKVTRQEGELIFLAPAGFRLQHQRSPVELDGCPVETLVTEQEALDITADTGRAGWDGFFPVDYAGAVDWLLELGGQPRRHDNPWIPRGPIDLQPMLYKVGSSLQKIRTLLKKPAISVMSHQIAGEWRTGVG